MDQLTKLLKQTEKEKMYFKDSLELEQKKKAKIEAELQELKEQFDVVKEENTTKGQEIKEMLADKLFYLQVNL